MKKPGWSSRVLVKYALLQIPSVVLLVFVLVFIRRWVDLSAWLIWGIVILWVAKDIILFPFVWRAYDSKAPGSAHSMVGVRGIAEERLDSSGYARVRGELWQVEVRGGTPVEKGEAVRVQGIRGLTLIVEPENKGDSLC